MNAKIFVAGHNGLVGSAVVRRLEKEGYSNLVLRSHRELDLVDQGAVNHFFKTERPDYVFLAAAKVGGILANSTYPAEFIYRNTLISFNVIHASHKYSVKRLLNFGSSCIYPKMAPQPLKENYLLSSTLEPTNEAYAVSKIAAIKLCRYYNQQYGTNFMSVMPTNLYGFNDRFDLKQSHVLPALLWKIHEAKINNIPSVEVWGTGSAMREFMFVDDLADAVVFLMKNYDAAQIGELINVGTGIDLSIKNLVQLLTEIVGYHGTIQWDTTKPDGTPRKLLDVSRLHALGWRHRTSLAEGIHKTYAWFQHFYDQTVHTSQGVHRPLVPTGSGDTQHSLDRLHRDAGAA